MNYSKYKNFIIDILFLRKKLNVNRAKSVLDIEFDSYQDLGAKLVIFDMDDTLTEFLGKPKQKVIDLLNGLKNKDFNLAIFSNSSKERTKELENIFKELDIYSLTRSDKPHPEGYREIMARYNVTPEQTIMIGDRLGTDIYGAFLADIKYLFLVEPYSYVFKGKKAPVYIRLIRSLEKKLASI